MNSDYPVRFDVEYPDRGLDRLTTFFRIFVAIPILILAALLGGGSFGGGWGDWEGGGGGGFVAGGAILFLPALLMILFREKYPRWWFDWNVELTRFLTRASWSASTAGPSASSATRSCSSRTATRPSASIPDIPGGRAPTLQAWS